MRKATVGSVLLAFLALAGNAAARGGMPEPQTGRGKIIESIYFDIYVAGMITFLVVMALLLWAIIRYRASSGVGRATFEKERENLKMEMTWIVIPLGVVLWVGAISYGGLVTLDEGTAPEDVFVEIGIEGSQWNWEALYPGGVSVFSDPAPGTGEVADDKVFVLPAGVEVLFNVTGLDVIHSFAIQEFDVETGKLGTQIGMVDANPSGPHQYNLMVVNFEEGEYRVQCKEMCLNPGHGYMRARIIAVPVAEYNDWLADKQLEVGADIIERLDLEVVGGAIAGPEDLTIVNGARIIAKVHNGGTAAETVHVGSVNVTVAPGATEPLVYNTDKAGEYAFTTASGGNLAFTVVDAVVVDVQLDDFSIIPSDWKLEGGKTYLVRVQNIGAAPHNLFVGNYDEAGSGKNNVVEWNSLNVGAGETTSFVITPGRDMSFETWCNVPGHRDLGMFGVLAAS